MSVKKIIVFGILLIATLSIRCLGQDSNELRIKQIQTEYEKINKEIKKFKLTQEDVNDRAEEGGILKQYYEGQILRKAALTLFGETGQSTTEYYFLNGNLVFVKEQLDVYTGPIDLSKGETEKIETNTFYFNKEKLIQWRDNDNKIVDRDQYPEKEIEILADVKNIIKRNK